MDHDAVPAMRRMAWLLTAASAIVLVATASGLSLLPGAAALAAGLVGGALSLSLALLAAGGWLAQERQRRIQQGAEDLFLLHNRAADEASVSSGRTPGPSAWRRWIAHRIFGHRWIVSDRVRVKSLAEIRSTLDASGALDGLPFMDEMAKYCGREARVYRVVDKIYDYGRTRLMRRLDDCVLLVGLRCDGGAHGGCEAACYLIWKSQWLESDVGRSAPTESGALPLQTDSGGPSYRCQYTQLADASHPMARFDWGRAIGPWVVGNVSARSFAIALLTRWFNALQSMRGGMTYPSQPEGGNDKTLTAAPLRAGDRVRVRLPGEIARSLDRNSKNKGLWFDRDMLKHCGLTYRVRGRIQKIIDVNSGALIPMKTPCIALEGVHYSGEFQGFGEQHDYLYWRELWLQRLEPEAESAA